MKCIDHLEFVNGICPDCNLEVNEYGNTEDQFDYCSFPCCGCDGAQHCMAASGASRDACKGNVAGMWSGGRDKRSLEAAFYTMYLVSKREAKEAGR